MPQTKVRVVGSGFTTFHYRGSPIAFLDSFVDRGAQPIGGQQGNGYEAITPLGHKHPAEIATSRVMGAGVITASIRELWDEPVWFQLLGLRDKNNLVDVWEALAADPNPVTCQMVIKPPTGPARKKIYHNCVISAIDEGETVQIGTLSVAKNVEIVYTHATHGS